MKYLQLKKINAISKVVIIHITSNYFFLFICRNPINSTRKRMSNHFSEKVINRLIITFIFGDEQDSQKCLFINHEKNVIEYFHILNKIVLKNTLCIFYP